MNPPYILHLPKWYPHSTDPLEGIFIKRHIDCTNKQFKSIVLFIRTEEMNTSNSFYQAEKFIQVNTIEYKVYYKKRITGLIYVDRIIKLFLFYYLQIKFLHLIFREHGRPALLVVHVLLRNAFMAIALKWLFKIPYLIIEHSTFYLQNTFTKVERFKNLLRKWVVRKSNYLVAVSKNLLNKLQSLGISHPSSEQLYNTVDTALFFAKGQTPNHIFRVLHVSEFNDEHKNVSGIIQAIKLIKDNPRPIHLNLVGYGKDTTLLLQKIKESGCEQNIHYLGKRVGRELANEYQNADLFILFSNKENMPCVLAEALCCGTPVISTRVGGIAEIINSSNGILIEKGNIKALADAMARCANEEMQFNRKEISENARQLFSENAVADKLKGIYLHIVPDLVK